MDRWAPDLVEREDSLAALLPVGQFPVQIHELVAPPRLTELAARLQAAVSRDQNWWKAYVAQAKPGEALPYDEKLGLSEPEYREMLALAGQLMLRLVDSTTLTVTRTPGGAYRLDGGSVLPELTGIVIDSTHAQAATPFGIASSRSEVHQSDAASPTGQWDGMQWKVEEIDDAQQNGRSVTFAIGRLRGSARGMMYLKATVVENGRQTANVTRILQYALR